MNEEVESILRQLTEFRYDHSDFGPFCVFCSAEYKTDWEALYMADASGHYPEYEDCDVTDHAPDCLTLRVRAVLEKPHEPTTV